MFDLAWPGGDRFADDGANRAVPPHQETKVGKVALNLGKQSINAEK